MAHKVQAVNTNPNDAVRDLVNSRRVTAIRASATYPIRNRDDRQAKQIAEIAMAAQTGPCPLGCSVPEIAAILRIARNTADNHKTRLMSKLGTNKAALLTRLAVQTGVSPMNDKLTPTEKRRSGRKRDGWN